MQQELSRTKRKEEGMEGIWILIKRCRRRLLRQFQDSKEQAVALHSSTLAWKIPLTEEPGRLQSMGLLRVGHD